MKNNLYRLIICSLFFICSYLSASGQKNQKLQSENRVILYEKDTVLQFYTQPNKLKGRLYPQRFYYWFHIDTILATQGSYNGRLLNGLYQSYYPNKNLLEEGRFQNGLKHGLWKAWYPTGQIMRLYNWKRGVIEGAFMEYDLSGRKKVEGNYKKNQLSGNQVRYDSSGKVTKTLFKSGMPVVTDSLKTKIKHVRSNKSKRKSKG